MPPPVLLIVPAPVTGPLSVMLCATSAASAALKIAVVPVMANGTLFVVDQSVLGRLLDYGSIHILGTGEGLEHLHKVRSPIELRNCITAR